MANLYDQTVAVVETWRDEQLIETWRAAITPVLNAYGQQLSFGVSIVAVFLDVQEQLMRIKVRLSNRLGHRSEWELTLPISVLQADNPEKEATLCQLRNQLVHEKQGLDYALARVEQHRKQIEYLEQRMMNVNVRQKRAKPAQ
jgi:hypothetical protein